MYSYRHFIRAIHALPGRPFPTAAQLKSMDAREVVVACTASALPLSSSTQDLLKTRKIDGEDLLSMSVQHLVSLGMKPGDAGKLMAAVDLARFGGPVTVQLSLGDGKEHKSTTFETPAELEAFLSRQGAAGLVGHSNALVISFKALREGEMYTLDFASGGSVKSDVALAKASYDTDSKVVIENVKRAVVEASLRVFGEALTADPRNDIPLKCEGELLGDVDSLFRGPTLHLLLERKRRLGDGGGAADFVISQMNSTRLAYSRAGLDVVDKCKCRVKSMVYAQAMGAQAQQEFLAAGIYVLCGETMAILIPTAPVPSL